MGRRVTDHGSKVRRFCKRCDKVRLFLVRRRPNGRRQTDCVACTRRRGRITEEGGGRSGTRVSYNCMVQRCTNPNAWNWRYYGGRGIKVCDRWLGPDGFDRFLEDMGERPHRLTLDRIDPDGDYEPKNCRWSTRKEQVENRRGDGGCAPALVTYRTRRKNYDQD